MGTPLGFVNRPGRFAIIAVRLGNGLFSESPVASIETPPVRMAAVAFPPEMPAFFLMGFVLTVPVHWQWGQMIW